MKLTKVFPTLTDGLRNALINEYNGILDNYIHNRWLPSELSGGRFSEVVFTIIDGYSKGNYSATPEKPKNIVDACKALERDKTLPRSFQILIPRLLPVLYEVRNNRGVGHVGGDVDPNHMDATFIVSNANWIMGELVRVFHDLNIADAQALVDSLVERTLPIIWQRNNIKRILVKHLSLKEQILLLSSSSSHAVDISDLIKWTEANNRSYFIKIIKSMHRERLLEYSVEEQNIEILPPGIVLIEDIMKKAHEPILNEK